MYTVYYDKNAQYADQSSDYVKIHKGGCGHYTKNGTAVDNHSGERQTFTTLIKACEYVEEKTGKLSSKFFCKHCFGKD
ncbi:hypothetical protein DPQ25_03720 [Hydrogeniiclostridium mannosilyticum]|uniref:Uncharacterized protein n=1 Tax=Hydrogeniiclostridium mannosilyticum TaxID=2764322 RepID=A0A328UFK4_9FIRM|nr:hypothetical protein [Hydrogeniiclostridium mannosilyticum]RAQ30607.1 hypothetical protein DPQ25_03720 [Hydrogeniiclostridium mannosilyticum]